MVLLVLPWVGNGFQIVGWRCNTQVSDGRESIMARNVRFGHGGELLGLEIVWRGAGRCMSLPYFATVDVS